MARKSFDEEYHRKLYSDDSGQKQIRKIALDDDDIHDLVNAIREKLKTVQKQRQNEVDALASAFESKRNDGIKEIERKISDLELEKKNKIRDMEEDFERQKKIIASRFNDSIEKVKERLEEWQNYLHENGTKN